MDDFKYEVKACEAHTDSVFFVPQNPLNRPNIHYKKPLLMLLLLLIIEIVTSLITVLVCKKTAYSHVASMCILVDFFASVAYCFILRKRIIIWIIHFYQHYAPDRIRLKCVFEPSCSEYMLLAVNKYGFFKGLYKGIKRLLRCHPPGGVDYP